MSTPALVVRMKVLGAQRTSAENNSWYNIFVCSVPGAEEVQNIRGLSVQKISTSKEVFETLHLAAGITECDLTLKQVPGPKGQIKFVCTGVKAVPAPTGKNAA